MTKTRKLIDADTACRIIGGENSPISPATLYRGIRAGRFPRPIKVGLNSSRFDEDEYRAVVEAAAEAREVAA